MELGTGEQVSWMNIGDEGTGSHLDVHVYEHRTVGEIDPKLSTQRINKSFERWGLPKEIKIDNGHPFVNPNGRDSPTKTILWWAGLGIKVTQNTPRCPQQNGIVECLQGTMCSWSNPGEQPSAEALQKRLIEESDFQRNHYRMSAKNRKTRIELYPGLETNKRVYDPNNFKMQLVYNYLSEKVIRRTIRKSGLVRFFGEYVYVGKRYFGLDVTITFDPIEKQWMVRKEDGTLLKTSGIGVPVETEIKEFAVAIE